MKSPDSTKEWRQLSVSIGNFIRYWGFRRIHGAIWAQLYLSRQPLNCTQLAKNLGLSKALVSPALDELIKYKLIKEEPAPNQKAKVYSAVEDVNEVIKHVLKVREAKMLAQITKDYGNLKAKSQRANDLNETRVEALGQMISSANLMLQIFLAQEDLLEFPNSVQL